MIRKAENFDKTKIVELFCSNIKRQRSYISHGEIQMGIATSNNTLSEDYVKRWSDYLDAQMTNFGDLILVYEQDGIVGGFIIGETDSDRNDEFGIICDLVVPEKNRNKGIGTLLLGKVIELLNAKGINDIYLESGVNNHEAHTFFEKKGFHQVSSIFRLNTK